MNPTIKNVIYLVGGLLVGGGAGVFGSRQYFKKKYSKIADQQIREMEDYYERVDAYSRQESMFDIGDEINPEHAENGRDQGVLSQEQRDEIRENMKKDRKKTDYAKMYRGEDIDPAEEESPEEDEEEIYEEGVKVYPNPVRSPRLISVDELGNLPSYIDHQMLRYYTYDDSLVDDGMLLENQEDFVGDCLDKYGFRDNDDETTIYVMNYGLDTVYEIEKMFASFEEY